MTDQPFCRPKTCKTCPMRGGFHLYWERRQEIMESVHGGLAFPCHSEVVHDDEGRFVNPGEARQCAGATTLLLREGGCNLPMSFADSFGVELEEDDAVPFRDFDDWLVEPEFAIPMGGFFEDAE